MSKMNIRTITINNVKYDYFYKFGVKTVQGPDKSWSIDYNRVPDVNDINQMHHLIECLCDNDLNMIDSLVSDLRQDNHNIHLETDSNGDYISVKINDILIEDFEAARYNERANLEIQRLIDDGLPTEFINSESGLWD